MKKLLLCRRGVAPPRPPRRRYQVGRVDLGFGKIYLSSNIVPIGILWTGFTFAPPLQSLSPFWGSLQRQGIALRSPWECLRQEGPRMRYAVERVDPGLVDLSEIVKTGGCHPLNPRMRCSVARVDRGLVDLSEIVKTGDCTPRPPERGYQVGRVDLGFGKIYLSSNIVPIGILWTGFTFAPPLQSLSPFRGSPQRQGQTYEEGGQG
jgi:hypothetical protein